MEISYSATSESSNRTRVFGPSCSNWRVSSEPMEPPAPVIITTLSRTWAVEQLDVGRDRIAAQQILHVDRDAGR